MRRFIDKARATQVCLLDSLSEVVEEGVDGTFDWQARNRFEYEPPAVGGPWYGRRFANRESAVTCLTRPWIEGLELMEEFRRRLAKSLPEPVSVRRRPTWSEVSGDLNVGRLLEGDPMMYRETRRQAMRAPKNVALLCNVGGNSNLDPLQLTWRGAAAVAVTDLLEQAGYNIELWCWAYSEQLYDNSTYRNGFMACRLKACGDPVDPDVLVNGLSSFCLRVIIFGAWMNPKLNWDGGRGNDLAGRLRSYDNGNCDHLDVSENVVRVNMEPVTSYESSVNAAERAIIQATEGGDL